MIHNSGLKYFIISNVFSINLSYPPSQTFRCFLFSLCNTKEKRKHLKVCDGGYDKRRKDKIGEKKEKVGINNGTDKLDRYRVPADLIYSLFLD